MWCDDALRLRSGCEQAVTDLGMFWEVFVQPANNDVQPCLLRQNSEKGVQMAFSAMVVHETNQNGLPYL